MSYSLLSQLSFELQLAGLWEEKLKEEQVKTGPLEEVCAALREALDAETKKRMEAFENKMKPIIIKDGPSRKVSTTPSFFLVYFDLKLSKDFLRYGRDTSDPIHVIRSPLLL